MSLTITNFLSELKALGVAISAVDGNIKIQGNLAALTPVQKDWLRHHKPAVLAMLQIEQNPVRRYVSLDGEAEAFSSHVLDPAYWRPMT
jgi:hypothetical protein